MELIFILFVFIFGLIFGSFLNVVIDRLPQKRSLWRGRSVCDSCHKKLGPLELIPVFSYLALKGKCKHCKAKIPSRLAFIELLTGFLFVFTFITQPYDLVRLIFVLLFLLINIAIFFIDLDYGIIPDELIVLFVIASLPYLFLLSPSSIINHILTGLIVFLLFLTLFVLTKGKGLGFGDVKLVFAMGLFLGFPLIIVALYFAFLTGAIISIALIAFGKKGLKSAVPFGPFLATGTVVAYFFGDRLLRFFFEILNL